MTAALAEQVRRVWAGLAGAPPGSFSARVPRVVVSPGSMLCPPGWVSLVAVEGAVLVTAPSQEVADRVGGALRACRSRGVTDSAVVSALLPVAEFLGPAWLSYPGSGGLAPRPGGHPVEHLTAGHPELRGLLGAVTEDDAAESALEGIGHHLRGLHHPARRRGRRCRGSPALAAGGGAPQRADRCPGARSRTGGQDGARRCAGRPRSGPAAAVAGATCRLPAGRCAAGPPGAGPAAERPARPRVDVRRWEGGAPSAWCGGGTAPP